MTIHVFERESKRESDQHAKRTGGRHCGQARVRDVLWHTDIDVFCEWRGDLVLEEMPETAMQRVDTTQQLSFIEPEGNRVIGLTRSGLPHWFLPGEHDCQAIKVGDHAAIDGFFKSKQPCLVREELAHGDVLFSLLGELGPVSGDSLFI